MPWIYVSEEWPYDRPPFERPLPEIVVEAAIRRAEALNDRRASAHSRALIHNTMSAMLVDPLPAWRESETERFSLYNRILTEDQPEFLQNLFGGEESVRPRSPGREEGALTYFETLHWVGRNLDRICPFRKEPLREEPL